MREYYFLSELEQADYRLSGREGLHLAATGKLPSYVYIHDEVHLMELEDGLVMGAKSFYLRIPDSSLRAIEKWMINQRQSVPQPSDDAKAPKKFELKEVFVDKRYDGELPGNPMPHNYHHHEVDPTPLHISTPARAPFTFSADELIFWAEDLEELADAGLIQRCNSGEDQKLAIDAERQEYPPHLEALIIAWRKYWKNVDRNDRSTRPEKDSVEAWLMEQGLSGKTASAGQTIIKPQWAIDKGW